MSPLLLSAFTSLVSLQSAGATVTGSVQDETTGNPLPNAVVSFTDLNRAVVTGSDGRYRLASVPAGPQHITVRYIGYAPRTLHAIVPRDGELRISVSLQPVPLRLPAIEVRQRVSVRGLESETDEWNGGRSLSMSAVRNHPLLSEPDVLQALSGGEVGLRLESPDGLHVRGGAADQTGYLLDGIPVLSPYHAGALFSALNPDALGGIALLSPAAAESPDALSGTIAATTRPLPERLQIRGGATTSQARLTVEAPFGSGTGFLLSVRSAFPGMLAAKEEASYLDGESGDWIARIVAPVLGGRFRLLGYDSGNEIGTAADAAADEAPGPVSRNSFEWSSRSWGGEWQRPIAGATLTLRAWEARGESKSSWRSVDLSSLGSSRRDRGALVQITRSSGNAVTTGGIRLQRIATHYQVVSDTSAVSIDGRTPVTAGFLRHERTLGRVRLTLSSSLAHAAGSFHAAPALLLGWRPLERVTLTAGLGRTHQYAQSLRNPESVAALVFPADLFVAAGTGAVPVARNDQVLLSAEYRPAAGVRLAAQGWDRRLAGLLLAAPSTSNPFVTGEFVTGSGRATGFSIEGGLSDARFGVIANYGWQRVRLNPGEMTYTPEHAGTHLLQAGVIVFPGAATSIRLGAEGAWGRRGTPLTGGLEYENCNLLDFGCEFSGSPGADPEAAGSTSLPAYFRVDLGLRHHWHIRLAGREVSLGAFGTITNVFGRKNLLARGWDPDLGQEFFIEMRPRAPLVAGIDWQF